MRCIELLYIIAISPIALTSIVDCTTAGPSMPVTCMPVTGFSHLCLQVSANDADSPPNSAISYSLLDDLGGLFRIDSMTGTVYGKGFFDAESDITQYTLTVVATDSGTMPPVVLYALSMVPSQNEVPCVKDALGVIHLLPFITSPTLGTPAMSSTATATITILDINDETPVFAQSQYFIELPENDNQTRILFTVCLEVTHSHPTIHTVHTDISALSQLHTSMCAQPTL